MLSNKFYANADATWFEYCSRKIVAAGERMLVIFDNDCIQRILHVKHRGFVPTVSLVNRRSSDNEGTFVQVEDWRPVSLVSSRSRKIWNLSPNRESSAVHVGERTD